MFSGALVDAGVSPKVLEEAVASLNIGGRLEISKVVRSGIAATKVDVYALGEKDLPHEEYWRQQTEQRAAHEHSHLEANHSHHHNHESGANASANVSAHDHHHGRSINDIRKIILASGITQGAKNTALSIFETLGQAEAKIHNTSIEKVHFHEVGAIDAMADIVCAAVGAETLGVNEWVCSPLNVGGGTVKCIHGTLPVPAPATVEVLHGAPVYSSGLNVELVTPTGAAIVKTLAARFASFPEMTIEKSGYGAGTRDFQGQPNVVRLTVGESGPALASKTSQDFITILEANLDDLSPQVFGYALERLLEEGALDAFGTPVQMKKNRPGIVLTALCRDEDADRLTQLIFSETSTLGVRMRRESRRILNRKWVAATTQWGDVRLKIASMNGTVTNYAPEYEDCRKIASQHHVPLRSVMQQAVQAYVEGRVRPCEE